MARPPKKLDTPELKALAKAKAELDEATAKSLKARAEFNAHLVAAFEKNGYRTLAKVTQVSGAAIQQALARENASSPRSKK